MGKKAKNQQKVTCYANSAQCRAIRAKMVEKMSELGSKGDLRSLVKTLITADPVFPVQNCFIRKVKVLKKPKFDVTALMEWYADENNTSADTGKKVATEETVAGAGGRY